jgi:flavin reductase (DIM6/NTAB) family NADH-FMN oxidoreductase RutF
VTAASSPDRDATPGAESTTPAAIDSGWFRQVLGRYPTGVCVVTALGADGGNVGMAVGSFTSVSLDPPLVAFLPDRSSSTWPRIAEVGRFCVNVLAADQEPVCRLFAAKDVDRFAGLEWRAATGSGAPIIDGVVAWIDCELDAVHEAGDHYIVVGRVLELDLENQVLPLLFFQGGYGRFTPQSLVTSELRLIDHFRHLDLIRDELETLARDAGVECNASVRAGDEIVIVATAGQPRGRNVPTRVGHRFAFVPPVGSGFVAWEQESVADAWLRRTTAVTTEEERDAYRRGLERIRAVGYDMLVGRYVPDPGEQASVPHEVHRFLQEVRMGGPDDVADFGPDSWATIGAPVFDRHGTVSLMIGLYGFDTLTPAEAERRAADLLAAAERITRVTGGRPPA